MEQLTKQRIELIEEAKKLLPNPHEHNDNRVKIKFEDDPVYHYSIGGTIIHVDRNYEEVEFVRCIISVNPFSNGTEGSIQIFTGSKKEIDEIDKIDNVKWIPSELFESFDFRHQYDPFRQQLLAEYINMQ
ncbi:hypothetical protein [Albibacterium profundi]|uniref:Uncharacterized protein n=1 Tax=Albibacterium profundi TaxID=3134906 RepID=A0ABV5CEY7_9SPHI